MTLFFIRTMTIPRPVVRRSRLPHAAAISPSAISLRVGSETLTGADGFESGLECLEYRYLEIAGRYEEIFAPEIMSREPIYHMHADRTNVTLRGQDQVKSLYRMWAETHQSIFYVENEEVAVADHNIFSVAHVYQQVAGKSRRATCCRTCRTPYPSDYCRNRSPRRGSKPTRMQCSFFNES